MLRYRYQNQAWQTIDADSYTFTDNPDNWVTLSYSTGRTGSHSETFRVYDTVLDVPPFQLLYTDLIGLVYIFSCRVRLVRPDGIKTTIDRGVWARSPDDFAIASSFEITLTRGTSSSCVFRAFKQGNLVKILTAQNCPEVEIVNDECPPDTCNVECGDTICCYNSNGISVFNYPKP